jgi:hypothetical protein
LESGLRLAATATAITNALISTPSVLAATEQRSSSCTSMSSIPSMTIDADAVNPSWPDKPRSQQALVSIEKIYKIYSHVQKSIEIYTSSRLP